MYRGRFAPSPTGLLHFGSLVAAVASYLEARRARGQWLIRIEDVDRTRCHPRYANAIFQTLAAFGMSSDEAPVVQSERSAIYHAALKSLGPLVYPCTCTRKDLAGEDAYPGRCRTGPEPNKPIRSLRLRVPAETICFDDFLQGRFCADLSRQTGDFPLYRPPEDMYTYQLAVVVDDHLQGITHIVRGADLLDSTPRQIYLQRCLGYAELQYLHIPVALDPGGHKLSKQNLAPAITTADAALVLTQALTFLGQSPPASLARQSLNAVWDWALANWDPSRIPPRASLPVPAMPA